MAKKKKAAATAPSLADLYNQVAARADTEGLQINAAESKRVLACLFDVLEDYSPAVAFDLVAKGLKRAGQRRR